MSSGEVKSDSPQRHPSTLLGTLSLWFDFPHHPEPVDGSKGRVRRGDSHDHAPNYDYVYEHEHVPTHPHVERHEHDHVLFHALEHGFHLVFILFFLLLAGCTAAPTEPPTAIECKTPRAFYVVSHGWHTGIVVDSKEVIEAVPQLESDFDKARFLEIGWGDEGFYRAQAVKPTLALRALLWPTSTVFHIVGVPDAPRRYFSGSEVVEVSVPQAGYEKLLAFLDRSFHRTSGNDVVKLGKGLYGNSRFYRAEGKFHLFNTCNTWVAKAIKETGYPISAATITVKGLMSQLHPDINAKTTCYSVR